MKLNNLSLLFFYFFLLTFLGCATAPYEGAVSPKKIITPGMPGIYHKVERGQTLWRISKIYSQDLDEIVRVNKISDVTNVEVGQLIFIPNRARPSTRPVYSSSDDFLWPVRGRIISTYGQTFENMVNKGINIQPYSNTEVSASRAGRVIFYKENFGPYGRTIIIEHGDGFSSVYARNAKVFVKVGDFVPQGSIIAKSGSSGRSKNAYLHFEIRKGHLPQNPKYFLP